MGISMCCSSRDEDPTSLRPILSNIVSEPVQINIMTNACVFDTENFLKFKTARGFHKVENIMTKYRFIKELGAG